MHLPILLAILIIFSLWLSYEIHKANTADDETTESYRERERQALFVRKKDMSNLKKIALPDNLPYMESSDINLTSIQDDIKKLADKDIINLTGMSNTDIRMEYGAPNFDYLSMCDNNYTKLSVLLNKWGSYLYEHEQIESAKIVLEFAVSIQCDISAIYVTLAKIYIQENSSDRISLLIKNAETIKSSTGKTIQKKLNELVNNK